MQQSTFPPGHPDAPPAPVPDLPAGMGWGISAQGERVPVYLPPPGTEAPAPSPASVPDHWPKRLLAGGGAVSMVAATVGQFAPQLAVAGHAVMAAGLGVGAAAGGVALLKGAGKGAPRQDVNVNVTVSPQTTVNNRTSSRSR